MSSLLEAIQNDPGLLWWQKRNLIALIVAGEKERAKELYELWTGKAA